MAARNFHVPGLDFGLEFRSFFPLFPPFHPMTVWAAAAALDRVASLHSRLRPLAGTVEERAEPADFDSTRTQLLKTTKKLVVVAVAVRLRKVPGGFRLPNFFENILRGICAPHDTDEEIY